MKFKRLYLSVVMMCYLLAACGHQEVIVVPDHFKTQVDVWDEKGYKRQYDLEAEPVYRVYDQGDMGLTIIQSVEAYEEPMLISVTLDGHMVQAVEILYENETDDYGGDYVGQSWFLDRLLLSTKDPLITVLRKKEKEQEVIAITGATITSHAVVMAVNKSIEIWEAYYNEHN